MAGASHWDAHASIYARVWEQSTLLWGRDALALVQAHPTLRHDQSQTPASLSPHTSSCASGRLLDVGCGAGALAIHATSLGYDVTAVDSSSAMVALLQAKLLHSPKLPVTAFVGDGQNLNGLEDASFEVVCSNFGIFLFPDTAAAWRSVWRVLVPGGSAVATSWDAANFNIRLMHYLLANADDKPEAEADRNTVLLRPVINRMMVAESFRDELVECHFEDVQIHTIRHAMQFPSGRDLVNGVLDNASFRAVVGHKQYASLQRCILDFAQLECGGGSSSYRSSNTAESHPLWTTPVALDAVAHVAIATKPLDGGLNG